MTNDILTTGELELIRAVRSHPAWNGGDADETTINEIFEDASQRTGGRVRAAYLVADDERYFDLVEIARDPGCSLAVIRTMARTDIMPPSPSRDQKSRIGRFQRWQAAHGQEWYTVDLVAYRDELLKTLKPSSVGAHLSTIRGAYQTHLAKAEVRNDLYNLAGDELSRLGHDDNPANRKALVDEMVTRIEGALDPKRAPVETIKSQDVADDSAIRLTKEQASELMLAPGIDTLRGARDTAIIAMALCTGLRESEIANLDVVDLRQRLGGELAVHVRKGKGCKERLVPYGGLSAVVAIVQNWLDLAGITDGPVFRGFVSSRDESAGVSDNRLSTMTIQRIVGRYPAVIEGKPVQVRPHDLRRTYAKCLYLAGVPLVAIQQNLGHASTKTTLLYIGELDASERRPPTIYQMGGLLRQGTLL